MSKYLVLLIFIPFTVICSAQISSNGASESQLTNYHVDYLTEGHNNDYIYIYNSTSDNLEVGSLTLNTNGEDFAWYKFENHVYETYPETTETISNLSSGCYRAVINDGLTETIYQAWVWVTYPEDLETINIEYPFESENVFSENTYAKVCFWGSHTFVSDIGFYLIAPGYLEANPGETGVVQLSPPPSDWGTVAFHNSWTGIPWAALGCSSAIDENTSCNSGNNFEEFCFSTHTVPGGEIVPAGNPDYTPCICDMATPLAGTFASVGNWEYIYSSLTNSSDWHTKIYDCENIDIGIVQRITLRFETITDYGFSVNEYDTGNINDTINDDSCDPLTSSTGSLTSTANYIYYKSNSLLPTPQTCYTNINSDYHNIIVWTKPESELISSFEVYRIFEGETTLISTIAYEDEPIFTDTNFDPDNGEVSYFVRSIGEQNWNSFNSIVHKNTFVNLEEVTNNEWILQISDYSGMNHSNYKIYRGLSIETLEEIATISNSELTYTDSYATGGIETFYRITFENTNNCDSDAENNIIYSNIVSTEDAIFVENLEPIKDIVFDVYPNPATDAVYIEVEEQGANIYLLDLNGRILFQQKNFQSRSISLKGLAPGVYIIKSESGSSILEKRLIIE